MKYYYITGTARGTYRYHAVVLAVSSWLCCMRYPDTNECLDLKMEQMQSPF